MFTNRIGSYLAKWRLDRSSVLIEGRGGILAVTVLAGGDRRTYTGTLDQKVQQPSAEIFASRGRSVKIGNRLGMLPPCEPRQQLPSGIGTVLIISRLVVGDEQPLLVSLPERIAVPPSLDFVSVAVAVSDQGSQPQSHNLLSHALLAAFKTIDVALPLHGRTVQAQKQLAVKHEGVASNVRVREKGEITTLPPGQQCPRQPLVPGPHP